MSAVVLMVFISGQLQFSLGTESMKECMYLKTEMEKEIKKDPRLKEVTYQCKEIKI